MNRSCHLKFHFFVSLFILTGCHLFISCSDTEPRLNTVASYVVLDYQEDGKIYDCRLAVFADAASDVRRVSKIEVESKGARLRWVSDSPEIFSSNGKSWAGYSSFTLPHVDGISGTYILNYYDALERNYEQVFTVAFPEDIYKLTLKELDQYSEFPKLQKVIIYNEDNDVIYYGNLQESWNNCEKLFMDNKNSYAYRKCVVISELKTVCLLPPVYRK